MSDVKVGSLLCCCGTWNDVYASDLGFEEFECADCECTMTVPDDPRDFDTYNNQTRQDLLANTYTGKVRIMAIQETGEEVCVVDHIDENLSSIMISGVRVEHPEYRAVFSEPELTLSGMLRFIPKDERIY